MSNNSTPFGQTPIDLSSTSGGVSRGSASLGQARVAIEAIKHHIISHNLQRGDPLPTETQMCNDLNVSRSSVREAVRTLSALDIVEVRHGRGMFVGSVSMRPMVELLAFRGLLNPGDDWRALKDIVQVRQALDLALAQPVIDAWQDKPSVLMEQILLEMEQLSQAGQLFPQQDRTFHNALLAPLNNHLFQQLTDAFWEVHMITSPSLGVPTPEDIHVTAQAHRFMYEAAVAGDADAYCEAVVTHYQPLLGVLDSK